jgi:hypothetical protein
MTRRTSAIAVAVVLLSLGTRARAEPARAADVGVPDAVIDAAVKANSDLPASVVREALRETETGTVVLHYYDPELVLGPFLAIEGAAYPVPCGNPAVGLFGPLVQGLYAEVKSDMIANVRQRTNDAGCELSIYRSRLVKRPVDWSRVPREVPPDAPSP